MRPWIFRWNLGYFAALSIVAVAWFAPKAIKILGQGSAQETAHTTFATLTSDRSSELYLKDARAFIFSRTDSGQNLKLHDSVLVGPKSEATLVLSDEFGGGKIRLAANTIITLSRAGRRNEIPRIDIKQGEIKILEAPRRPKHENTTDQKTLAEVATNSEAGATVDDTTQVAQNSEIENSELPGILITSGENAIVFDETIKNAELVAMPQSNSFEIKMPLAAALSEPAKEDEVSTQIETPSIELSQTSTTVSPVLLEEIEGASLQNETLAETVVKIQEAKLANTKALATRREPATETKVDAPIAEAEPPKIQVKAPVKTIKKEEPKALSQEETSAVIVSKEPTEEVHAEPAPTARTEEKFYPLEISAALSQRSYPVASGKVQATDFDFGFKGENKILPRLNVALIANLAILNLKKPTTGAPRPLSFLVESKYQALPDKNFWLVGGYSYQTSTITGSTTNYENVYAPHFGVDSTFQLSPSQGYILFAPRFSLISSGSYWFSTPVTYYWNPRWGVGFNYNYLKIKADGKSEKVFQSYSSGLRWKF